jgi:hypothetical protein
MINPRHRKIVNLFFSQLSTAEVAFLCRCSIRRVNEAWQIARDRGELPNIDRKSEGFSDMCIFLGAFGNQCSPERRIA